MRRSLKVVLTAAVALTLSLGFVSCAEEPASPPSPAVTVPTQTTDPVEPSEPAVADLATCDTVLDQAGLDDLASTNLRPAEFEIQSWDYPILNEILDSGVVCKWANSGDVFVVVGQLATDEQTWEGTTRPALETEGYVSDDSFGFDSLLINESDVDDNYPSRGVAWRDGILYYFSYPGILKFVPAFQS